MKRLRWLTVLMGITLIIIMGFQAYWLHDNYEREKRSMQIKSGVAFQETIQELQAKKIKLPEIFLRSGNPGDKRRIFVEQKQVNTKPDTTVTSRSEIVTTTKIFNRNDDTIKSGSVKQPVFIVISDSNGIVKRIPLGHRFDSTRQQIFFNNPAAKIKMSTGRRQIITTINILRSKLKDSLRTDTLHSSFFIKVPKDTNLLVKRTMPLRTKATDSNDHFFKVWADSNNQALRVLYSVDSLQDSLQLPEITKAYSAALKKLNLAIPFSIARSAGATSMDEDDMSAMTVGFANPVTYHLALGNTTSYLFKRISLPILFSLFLVGITLFSFVLLYRNLLRQQRLAEIKNDFISNITHELKTPIATVGVAIEALKNFNAIQDPQKTKEYLDISANELQRLSLLVDKVLKLSMFEKKAIELSKENFDMRELSQEVLDTMRLQFEKNNAVVNFNTQGNDFIINADKLHITSVIYNLLDNALKYRNGSPVINVHLSAQPDSIELKVADNGIGIAHEYQSKIFDKFFRVPTGNKHIVKGYGLGLSYVSHIIAQHKGTIHVASELNKGSIFIIKIPKHGEG